MVTLKEICKKDRRYKDVIKESSLVKNAIILLGGRRRENGGKEGDEKEKEEEIGDARREGGKKIEPGQTRIGEKISLIELLSELVKGGVEMPEEEDLKEVLMELEEEGNTHVEEEMEEGEEERGEGKEEKEEEKREWEELSVKARTLVFMMEKLKRRREGKRSESLKMMKKEREEERRMKEEAERGREEEKKRADEENRKREEAEHRAEERSREYEERIEKMEKEMEEMKKEGIINTLPPAPTTDPTSTTQNASGVITSLDGTTVVFPQTDDIKREGNAIIHQGSSFRNCFIGGVMTSVCNVFPSSILPSFSLSFHIYRESIGCMYTIHSSFPHSISFSTFVLRQFRCSFFLFHHLLLHPLSYPF